MLFRIMNKLITKVYSEFQVLTNLLYTVTSNICDMVANGGILIQSLYHSYLNIYYLNSLSVQKDRPIKLNFKIHFRTT